MIARILFFIVFSIVSLSSNAKSLCSPTEKTVFSFETKSKKFLSICKNTDGAYLTYKFGTPTKIELQFPNKLDQTSWRKFEFSGMRRAGGKMNAGFGEYTLTFENGNAEYTVFQEWSDEDGTYSIGVAISGATDKTFTISGIKKTQEGSLVLLEDEGARLPNKAE